MMLDQNESKFLTSRERRFLTLKIFSKNLGDDSSLQDFRVESVER